MNRDNHFIKFRNIIQRLVFVTKPNQLIFTISATNVNAKVDQFLINGIIHGVRICHITRTFYCNSSLIIRVTGTAPTSVSFVYTKNNPSICTDSIITGRFYTLARKAVSNCFGRELTNHTMRRNSINGMCSSSTMIRTFYSAINQTTITHYNHPFVLYLFLRALFSSRY